MFDPGSVHVGFVVKKVAVGLVFLLGLQIHLVIVCPSIDRTNSLLFLLLSEEGVRVDAVG